jgi:hypothetical protein
LLDFKNGLGFLSSIAALDHHKFRRLTPPSEEEMGGTNSALERARNKPAVTPQAVLNAATFPSGANMKFQFLSCLAAICGFAFAACEEPKTESSATPAAAAPAPASVPPASADSAATADSAEADEAAISLREHHRHHHAAGITSFVMLSLDSLGTDQEKPEIKKLQADLNLELAPAHEAERVLLNVLADGIASGKIDKVKADDAIAGVGKAAGLVHDASAGTLNELHATLSPIERATLAEKVRSHWEIWKLVNHEAEAGGKEEGGRLAILADDVDLTADQVDKLSGALRLALADMPAKFDPKEVATHVEAFATAFAAETFDAKSLSSANGVNGRVAVHGATRMAMFYETVAPALTPDQRTKLTENMHDHLKHQLATAGR